MTYLLPPFAAISVNGWTLGRITDFLQDSGFSRICSSYDEDSELELWNSRVGLLAGLMAGLIGTHRSDGVGIDSIWSAS